MILIGVPCSEAIKSRTAFSLYNLASPNTELLMEMSCDVANNRNKIVREAIRKNATHILFIDSDMGFESDTLVRMLEHNKDILGLAANRRRLPLESVVKPLDDAEVNKKIPPTLFEAKSCGTGVMLIKTEVFKKLSYPYFEFNYDKEERIGEDVNFCRKARELGYKIWVDPTIPVVHWGEYAY